jgi:hypothetical protein
MGAFEASLERGTLHELVSSGFTSRAVQRVTEIRNDLALLSDSMASLTYNSLTTSMCSVDPPSSALLYRQKQLQHVGAGAAEGAAEKILQ